MKVQGQYYKGIHNPLQLTAAQYQRFNDLILRYKCDVFSKIKVIQRIGSESAYATIWEIEIEDMKMVVKIQKDKEKSLREIDINNFLIPYDDYFLKFYDSLYCNKIEMKTETFDGYFMFMELAIGDLEQFLIYNNVSDNQLQNFIAQVFDSIYVLGKLQLFHGDLHIKNVFIVVRNGLQKAVIGDFGETIGIDSITSHTSDLYRFVTSLLELLNRSPQKYFQTKNKLKQILVYVNKITSKIENDYDKWNEQNRDDEGNVDLDELDKYFDKVVSNTIGTVKRMILL